jgi:hypothetical protein
MLIVKYPLQDTSLVYHRRTLVLGVKVIKDVDVVGTGGVTNIE